VGIKFGNFGQNAILLDLNLAIQSFNQKMM